MFFVLWRHQQPLSLRLQKLRDDADVVRDITFHVGSSQSVRNCSALCDGRPNGNKSQFPRRFPLVHCSVRAIEVALVPRTNFSYGRDLLIAPSRHLEDEILLNSVDEAIMQPADRKQAQQWHGINISGLESLLPRCPLISSTTPKVILQSASESKLREKSTRRAAMINGV